MAEPSLADRANVGEENSCSCEGKGWVPYSAELLDGTTEEARQLCECWRSFVTENASRQIEKIHKAQAVFEKSGDDIIATHDGRVYWVPSASRAGLLHGVQIEGEECCSCEDYQFNHNTCWHITAATIAQAKSAPCTLCNKRHRTRYLIFASEGQANLGEGQPICLLCADVVGVA